MLAGAVTPSLLPTANAGTDRTAPLAASQAIDLVPAAGAWPNQAGPPASAPVGAGAMAAAPAKDAASPPADTSPTAFAPPANDPAREPGVHTRIGDLQQGADFLNRLGQALQGLKQQLGNALAAGSNGSSTATAPASLQQTVDGIAALWQARVGSAGGSVDSQLQVVAGPSEGGQAARQRFRLRGLDADSLAGGGAETLRLRLPGQTASVRVMLEGSGLGQGLQALQGALAPLGVQVQAQGSAVWFSVDESRWPAVRDGLTVQGDGRRFPGGQAVRPLIDAEPAALQPSRWRVDSSTDQRATLQQVVQAQGQVTRAQRSLAGAWRQAASAEASTGLTPASAADTANALAQGMQQADFQQVAQLAPALRGLHAARVRQLLAGS